MSTASDSSPGRIVSMDQFRGYTVAGMFVVNFVGGLRGRPEVMKHHNGHPYFSYADTIMPSFMFAAGFSYRLTALRRLAQIGPARRTGSSWSAAWAWSWSRWSCMPLGFRDQELVRHDGHGSLEIRSAS